jgi:glycine dehydrogenase
VLLAVVASMYAVYHGPDGLRAIARRVHSHANSLATSLRAGGVEVVHDRFFDTVLARVPGRAADVVDAARQAGIWLRLVDADHVGVSCDEKTDAAVLGRVCAAFGVRYDDSPAGQALPDEVTRTSDYLTHPVFNTHRSETAMLRYLRRLSDYDYALDRGMIPLGSCTMKLNATTEMAAVTWPEFADLHPFAPIQDAAGYVTLIGELERWLAEVTGYAKVSLQPNAGSQGELAGLLAIRSYHRSRGDDGRTVCLIPSSAHGTNAASAVMAGMRVVVVKSNNDGTIDLDDLRAKADEHADRLAAIMITYPSTHGVYEESVTEVCRVVHDHGGQVYVDGANLNALLGPGQARASSAAT